MDNHLKGTCKIYNLYYVKRKAISNQFEVRLNILSSQVKIIK